MKQFKKNLFTYSPILIGPIYFFFISKLTGSIIYFNSFIFLIQIIGYLLGIIIIVLKLDIRSKISWFISIVYSFFIFYLGISSILTLVNYNFSRNQHNQIIICKVDKFSISTRRTSNIQTHIKGVKCKLFLNSKNSLKYQVKNFNGEKVFVKVYYHEGLFNSFIIDNFIFIDDNSLQTAPHLIYKSDTKQ